MIGISTIDQNTSGAVVLDLHPTPKYAGTARVQRTKTLDGSAVLNHFGFADADRTVILRGLVDDDTAAALRAIFAAGDLIHISTDEGFFRAAIESLEIENGEVFSTVLLGESLHE